MTFYIKYRSQSLDELDLTSVRESLTKIVSSGNIPHAFLFSGPKGTGKTSAARIVAKIVNCEKAGKEPCNKCSQCKSITAGTNIDVIELDAASNRGIDDIRVLRDAVKLAPAKAKKKVYIIDEAHMLTTEASNALLKTLEEPPSHVMFILATTNPEKLLETIRSRTTLIEFKKGTADEIVRSLLKVVKGEKIKIEKDALFSIAKASNGSFRDATKILEQLTNELKDLTKEKVEEYLFNLKTFDADEFIDILLNKDVKKALNVIGDVLQKGGTIKNLIDTLVSRLRIALLSKVGVGVEDISALSKEDAISLVELFSKASYDISFSPMEEIPLEIAVIRWCEKNKIDSNEEIKAEEGRGGKKEEVKETKVENRGSEGKAKDIIVQTTVISEISEDVWKNILAHVRPINTSIEALLRAARPVKYDGKILTLGVYYKFHKERLEESPHRRILEDVVAGVLGNPVKIVCTLTEPPARKIEEVKPEAAATLTEGGDSDIIKVAEEIFGN